MRCRHPVENHSEKHRYFREEMFYPFLFLAFVCTERKIEYMCGIIGYVGKHDSVDILLDGLRQLEYRGYDSAGIAVYGKSGV